MTTEILPAASAPEITPQQESGLQRLRNNPVAKTAAWVSAAIGSWLASEAHAQQPMSISQGSVTSGEECQDSEIVACLYNGRFRVTLKWDDFQGNTNKDALVRQKDQKSVNFQWAEGGTEEVILGINPGCPVNDYWWNFATAKTTAGFRLKVEDLVGMEMNMYTNPHRNSPISAANTEAFPTCDSDEDGDGVLSDGSDKCPSQFGTLQGCPETYEFYSKVWNGVSSGEEFPIFDENDEVPNGTFAYTVGVVGSNPIEPDSMTEIGFKESVFSGDGIFNIFSNRIKVVVPPSQAVVFEFEIKDPLGRTIRNRITINP